MRPMQRKDAGHGDLTNSQKWHLHRGEKFYQYSGFRLDQTPFSSPEARRQAWVNHKAELLAEAKQPIPPAVADELLLTDKYRKPGTTWAFRPYPSAHYEYENEVTGEAQAEDIATGPDGPETAPLNAPARRPKREAKATARRPRGESEKQTEPN